VVVAIPVLLTGGTEIQTLALVRTLAGRYRVTVCCYHEHDEGMVERFRALSAEVVLLRWRRAGLWRFVFALRKVLASLRPDVVHVQYLAPGLAAVLAARLAGVRVVLTTVHLPGYGLRARLFGRAARCLSDSFICVSESLERLWCGSVHTGVPAAGVPPHRTIHNCVDLDALATVAKATDPHELRKALSLGQKPIIGVVGRLRTEKGQEVLLAALGRVLQAVPEATLLVVGDGPDRAKLTRLAEELGVSASVRWVGHVAPEHVAAYYTVMDVLAVPSLYEGFGLVAAEAMALGIPVVVTDTAGLSEVVGNAGVVVPPGNAEGLAGGVVRVLQRPETSREMATRGRDRVRALFSRERFERDILMMYEHAMLGCSGATSGSDHR
jgi:glycosyltransferase involved in cell wall biosynthesis